MAQLSHNSHPPQIQGAASRLRSSLGNCVYAQSPPKPPISQKSSVTSSCPSTPSRRSKNYTTTYGRASQAPCSAGRVLAACWPHSLVSRLAAFRPPSHRTCPKPALPLARLQVSSAAAAAVSKPAAKAGPNPSPASLSSSVEPPTLWHETPHNACTHLQRRPAADKRGLAHTYCLKCTIGVLIEVPKES